MFLQKCVLQVFSTTKRRKENDIQVVGCPNSTDEGG